MEQECTKCRILKPLTTEFFYYKKTRNKFYRECINCYSERNKFKKITNEQRKKYNEQKKAYYYTKYKWSESRKIASKKAKKKWKNSNSINKLKDNLRTRVYLILKKKKFPKKGKFLEYIGCDYITLVQHIERQFTENMCWENYGIRGWHIDHIIPLSSAKSSEELYLLCHYTNLQPLWARDNYSKKDKMPF